MVVPRFKQEGISQVTELIEEGDDIITADLKDGFNHVAIRYKDQRYFGMCWRNQFYVFTKLPFGASCSPYFFNKILRQVITYLREQNLRTTVFVDDFFQVLKPMVTTDHKDVLLHTLDELGWDINEKKSQIAVGTSEASNVHRLQGNLSGSKRSVAASVGRENRKNKTKY